MVTITNQMLYNALKAEFSKYGVTEVTAEDAYSYFAEELSNQEGFSEEMIEKCASVAFDAANDCYNELCGNPPQSSYSEDNLEDLFTSSSQDEFATWVGRGAAHIAANLKGLKQGIQYIGRKRKYLADKGEHGNKYEREAARKHGSGFMGRMATGRQSYMDRIKRREELLNKKSDLTRKDENAAKGKKLREAREASEKRAKAKRDKKGFFKRFNDDKGTFMGMGKKGVGIGKWAKQNKAQAATAAGVGAAVVAGGAYATYKAIKKRNQAKAAQAKQSAQAADK